MDTESGCAGLRAKPEDNINELKQKYPRATAYLIAESEAYKDNYELSAIGKRALERIINGENHEMVLDDMKKEQHEFCNKHIWD